MTLLMTDTDQRIALTTGHVFMFTANEPQEVPEALVVECRKQGAFPAGQPAPKADEVADDFIIDSILDVMNEILQSGDPNLLTVDRLPRIAEVKRRMSTDFSKAQYGAALERLDSNG